MQLLRWEHRPKGLRSPVLICAFRGFNDAAESATAALTSLGVQLDAHRFATIDPENFVDFQSARPMIKLSAAGDRELQWPEFELYSARVPHSSRDVVLLTGPEPAIRWRSFCETVVELADVLGIDFLVTLGALFADVPHTRPAALTGLASDGTLMERMGLQTPDYEGPTGIVGVLYSMCCDVGIPAASIWAAVPHYVAVSPNPKATFALLRKLESLIEIAIDAAELEEASIDYERQVSQAADLDPDVRAFVEQLERSSDANQLATDDASIPSGEVLAREFQRFLRQRAGD